jgi:transcriptional regulator with XRE-family HTH domain
MTQVDLQIGGRIKRLRRQKSVSQAQLAEALEISASYLNLLEHNRRRITVPLLFRVAGYFGWPKATTRGWPGILWKCSATTSLPTPI